MTTDFKELSAWAVEQGLPGASNGSAPLDADSLVRLTEANNDQATTVHGHDVTLHKKIGDDQSLVFQASNIRSEKTGVHARIDIFLDRMRLGFHTFNVERDDDRGRFSNKCHKLFGKGLADSYPKELLQHDLDKFCGELWRVYIQASVATELEGNLDLPLIFLLKPYVIEGGGTIIFAPPGRGKSWTILLMAQSINCGISDIWPVAQVKVLFINLERSAASIQRRLGLVNTTLGLPGDAPLLTLNVRGKSLADIRDVVAATVEQYGVKLIVLDSISRAGQGSLTEDRPVNAIIDTLNNLATSWVAVAHTPRADEGHLYGSVHFEAGADVVVRLSSEKSSDAMGIALEITKENDIGPTAKNLLAYEFDQHGLYNVRPARQGEFIDIETGKQNIVDQLEEYILEHGGKATATAAAKDLELNRGDVSGAFNNSERFLKLGTDGNRGILFGVKSKNWEGQK